MEVHVELTGNTCRILLRQPEGKGSPRHRREDNIKNECPRSMMERGLDCYGL
jgi:hypothetical protein